MPTQDIEPAQSILGNCALCCTISRQVAITKLLKQQRNCQDLSRPTRKSARRDRPIKHSHLLNQRSMQSHLSCVYLHTGQLRGSELPNSGPEYPLGSRVMRLKPPLRGFRVPITINQQNSRTTCATVHDLHERAIPKPVGI